MSNQDQLDITLPKCILHPRYDLICHAIVDAIVSSGKRLDMLSVNMKIGTWSVSIEH